jgi:enoyl-CoA hydratase/carnithine racemase
MSIRRYVAQSGVTVVLMDRPGQLNALNMDMVAGIGEALKTSSAVLVLGSTEKRAFSSGADRSISDSERARLSDALYGLYIDMRESDTVIIAGADGHAVGGGAQLLLAADIRIGGKSVSVRFAGPGHGLVVGAWGLPSLVGRGRAVELCLSMRSVDAEEAFRIGLIDRLVEAPLEESLSLADEMIRLDRSVLAGVKLVTRFSDPLEALRRERALNSRWGGSIADGSRS